VEDAVGHGQNGRFQAGAFVFSTRRRPVMIMPLSIAFAMS
jgi:hypothetical protein